MPSLRPTKKLTLREAFRKGTVHFIVYTLAVCVDLYLLSPIGVWLWSWAVAPLFHVPALQLWQSFIMFLVLSVIQHNYLQDIRRQEQEKAEQDG